MILLNIATVCVMVGGGYGFDLIETAALKKCRETYFPKVTAAILKGDEHEVRQVVAQWNECSDEAETATDDAWERCFQQLKADRLVCAEAYMSCAWAFVPFDAL